MTRTIQDKEPHIMATADPRGCEFVSLIHFHDLKAPWFQKERGQLKKKLRQNFGDL